jgi:hypothetical protein
VRILHVLTVSFNEFGVAFSVDGLGFYLLHLLSRNRSSERQIGVPYILRQSMVTGANHTSRDMLLRGSARGNRNLRPIMLLPAALPL